MRIATAVLAVSLLGTTPAVPADFETILLPVYSPPVHGAFGSEFHTLVRAVNKSADQPVLLYGVDTNCLRASPGIIPVDPAKVPVTFEPNGQSVEVTTACSSWPARVLLVPTEQARLLAMNLRVRDVSRAALSHGTEIPVVRGSEMRHERIALQGVPRDTNFRSALRIYAPWPADVTVTVSFLGTSREVRLQPGKNQFEPSYALFTDFPLTALVGNDPFTVTIDPPPIPGGVQPTPPGLPIWAMVSVTNNTTQEVTTITPD